MIGPKCKKQFLVLSIVFAVILTGIAGCGRKPQDDATLAVLCPNGENHEFDMEITHADCTQRGYTTGTCQKCGYTYIYDMVNALGHQWGAPVSVKPASCTEVGLQNKSCSRCGITQEESLAYSGHSYTLAAAEGDEEQETVEYVCTICGDVIIWHWDEPLVEELKEKTFLPDRSADFTFLIRCDQGEDYLRNNLTLTGEKGAISYDIAVEENDMYRIAATEPYEQYQTYQVRLAEDMLFPEYNAKALDFSIIGPDRAEVEFNDDNLIFLKKLELREYGKSGLYELQWDEAAQRYYLTLFELRDIKPSMIGKVIGIGDYASTEEILSDSTRELYFAKLEKISHNAEGDLLLELSVPQLSEVYDRLDLYFASGTEGMQVSGDPELAFMNAVVNSEGFAEYLTAAHLAAESYAGDYGLAVTPLAANSKDNLQFKLTKHSLSNTEDSNTCKLELGGEITYTIPLKTKAGQTSGSIVMTCNAELTASISAGGHFKDKESVNLYLTNATTTTLSFGMEFNLEYSHAYEESYLLHKNTQKIHTSTCRIANKETDPANLQKLTAQELSEWYHGDRETMQKHECKVCLAVTGLDGTAYAYNRNTGVLHCMNCRHVTNIKDCNLYTLYPDNTISFTTCNDCRPQDRQVKDFDNRMLNAIKGSDWAEQVTSFQEMLGDSIGSQKPSANMNPNLSVPINIAGVFNIEIGVAPVFEFDMEASVNFSITASTTNTYGIRSVGEGFETYNYETPGQVKYNLNFTGEADAKFGIAMVVKAYPVGCEEFACIAINGQVGLYGHFTGVFALEGTVEGDTDVYCAARLEVGLYARMDGYWKILWFDGNFQILKEQRLPLFKWGYDRMYYAFEEEEIEWIVEDSDEFVLFNLPMLMKAKYLDLATMEYKTDTISPVSKSRLSVTVEIKNEDGSTCDYLEYIPQNGMIHKKDNAPESFTAVITVRVTPKVQIDSLKDFLASETKEIVCGYSMDPLVVMLKAEEEKTQPIDANDLNAINALLIGVGYPPDQAASEVTSWSDERIFNIICSKRLWDWDSAYLAKLGIGDEFSIDLSSVEELTQDMFGREFPVNVKSELGSISGNKLHVELIMGESTELVVQNGTKQGNKVTVVGSVYHHYVPFSEFHGYFQAELVENPSSIYGYTLTSIYRTEGNQNFDNITASASSELKETNLTHYANRVIDGDLDTAWVEGVRGVGINEWIMLETTDNSKVTVSAIEFSLGYQKSDQLLKNNGWPNKVLIECESGYTQEAEFYICDYSSVVVLDQPQTTSWIKITILDAYSGAKYDDTCISEICLYGIDPDTETTPDEGESLTIEHDFVSETDGLAQEVNISEEEAYQIACDYWNYSEGDVSSETGFDLYLVYDGLLEGSNGTHYYAFRLRWWVPENNMLSTVDYLYINAETGECSYYI